MALGLGKDSEQEWVPEEGLQATVDGSLQEALGRRCAQARQNSAGILPGEGVKPQEVEVLAVDSRGQFVEVISSQPGLVAARKPKGWLAQLFEPAQEHIQGLALVATLGTNLIEAVYEASSVATPDECRCSGG